MGKAPVVVGEGRYEPAPGNIKELAEEKSGSPAPPLYIYWWGGNHEIVGIIRKGQSCCASNAKNANANSQTAQLAPPAFGRLTAATEENLVLREY